MGDKTPYLVIRLDDDIHSVPEVIFKGEIVTGKVTVAFLWETKSDKSLGKAKVLIDHYEKQEDGKFVLKGLTETKEG